MSGCKAMAASPTPAPKRADSTIPRGAPPCVLQALQDASVAGPVGLPVAVAYSGGADSTALLHAAAACWPEQVRAIHVYHGLQRAADDFEQHCRSTCAGLSIPLHVVRVDARHAPGESPEDAARKARYQSLADAARAAGVSQVLLGQHADDQVETMLLALSRGAGVAGLAGMPVHFERHGMAFWRPLLGVSGAQLREELRAMGIGFVEDPTNADAGYTRNRIRARLLPALGDTFVAWRETFARSAAHAAQAAALIDEYAALDLAAVGLPPRLAGLQALSPARQAQVLRLWLKREHATVPSTVQLGELLAQIADCNTRGHRISLRVGAGQVLRDGDHLRYEPPVPPDRGQGAGPDL